MPKCSGKVLAIKDSLAKIEFGRTPPPVGEIIRIKWGKQRSLKANSLYWAYLTYVCEECDLWKDHAHIPETIHESVKHHFLSEKTLDKGTFKIIEHGSTTDLDCKEFNTYLEKVDSFLCDFFGIDTSKFWAMAAQYSSMY